MATLIETTQYFFSSNNSFSKETIANKVSAEYHNEVKKLNEIADDFLDSDDYEEIKANLAQKMNENGYLLCDGIGDVDFEIHTPTHLIQVLKEYASAAAKKAQVFAK